MSLPVYGVQEGNTGRVCHAAIGPFSALLYKDKAFISNYVLDFENIFSSSAYFVLSGMVRSVFGVWGDAFFCRMFISSSRILFIILHGFYPNGNRLFSGNSLKRSAERLPSCCRAVGFPLNVDTYNCGKWITFRKTITRNC